MHMIRERGTQQSRAKSMEPYSPASNSDTYHILCILALIFLPEECKVNTSLRLLQLFLLCSHQVVSDSLLPHLLQPASKSVRFPRQEHLSGLPCSSPGDLPNPGTEPESPALASRFFTTEPPRKPVQMLNTR